MVNDLQVDPKTEIIYQKSNPKDHQLANSETSNKESSTRTYMENVYNKCFKCIQSFWNEVRLEKNGAHTNRDLESNAAGSRAGRHHEFFPPNYVTCFNFLKFPCMVVLDILGLGYAQIRHIAHKKEKHTWSLQIMNKLVDGASSYEYADTGSTPLSVTTSLAVEDILPSIREGNQAEDKSGQGADEHHKREKNEITISIAAKNGITKIAETIQEYFPVAIQDKDPDNKNIIQLTMQKGTKRKTPTEKRMTPILIAAKNGITEIVKKILDRFPIAIHDMNAEKKNIVLLAVENRQPHVYQLLLDRENLTERIFRVVDNDGNSALHLAAKLGDHKPWLIPGAALQMQWEIKWYEFVMDSKPLHFFNPYNKDRKTSEDLFTETHRDLVKEGGEWLNKTSESCSVVAALIATVAFATSTAIPGGVKQDIGTPTLGRHPAFSISAISSVVALCLSVTALVMFLAILTSRYQERDFGRGLPKKLLVGLTSLFLSIASVLISFCAGDYFVLKDNLRAAVFPVYAAMCLPVTFYALAQLPLYLDLAWATFKKVPQRSDKAVPL